MTNSGAPLIRWAGSKRSALTTLLRFTGERVKGRYIEPFCGSAALYFRLHSHKAILSDINFHLVNFYKQVQRRPLGVYREATAIPRTKRAYYCARKQFNTSREAFERAYLFYYLNKNCFNGLFRTSKVGEFNVPFSKARVGEYPTPDAFSVAARSLHSATFICADFEEVLLRNARRNDLVFLDPPYSTAKRYPFREYFPGCFAEQDIDRLIRALATLDERGAHFVLTFSSALRERYDLRRWASYTIRTRRNISGFASHRRYVDDIIVTNRRP